jgi:hypothetical protein
MAGEMRLIQQGKNEPRGPAVKGSVANLDVRNLVQVRDSEVP